MREQALANFSALIESTDDPIWSVDLEYRLIVFNRALQKIIERNFSGPVAVGLYFPACLPIESAVLWPELYERAVSEGSFQTEFALCDGRFFEFSFHPIIAEGKAAGVSVFGKDITDRKSTENAIQKAEKKYRAFFDGALEGMFQVTGEGKPLTVNRAMAKMLGYDSAEECLSDVVDTGRDVWVNPLDREEFIRILGERDAVREFKCQFRRRDGNILWVSMNCRRAYSADGKTHIHEGFIEDITESRQVELALMKSERLFRAMTETSPLAISLMSLMSDRIEYINPTFTKLFGYTLDEIPTAAAWWPRAYPDPSYRKWVSEEWMRRIEHALATGSAFESMDVVVTCKDGSKKDITWGLVSLGDLNMFFGIDFTERKRVERALHDSESMFRTITTASPLAIVLSNADERHIYLNPAFTKLFGYTTEEIPSLEAWWPLAYPDEEYRKQVSEEWQRRVARERETGTPFEPFDVVVTCKDGLKKDVTWGFVSLGERNMSFGIDFTGRKRAEMQLRESEERYRTAFQTSIDALCISHLDNGRYVDVNQAFLDLFGYERQEVIGRTSLDLGAWMNPSDREKMLQMVQTNAGYQNYETQFLKKDGSMFWGRTSTSMLELGGVPCVMSITRDITQLKSAEEEIRSLAFNDPLTGLLNRRMFLERLRQSLEMSGRSGHKKALLFVDLDEFKPLNDSFGHQTGDFVLQQTAERIVCCVRKVDTAARLGGDEFVVLLEDLSEIPADAAAQAKMIGQKILVSTGLPHSFCGSECRTTASIGIAVIGGQLRDPDVALQQADLAMYRAKAAGGNTICLFEAT
jgi:diguanylate cyclase (GGDEF)-like protein/PAS domain S-box-containing protein